LWARRFASREDFFNKSIKTSGCPTEECKAVCPFESTTFTSPCFNNSSRHSVLPIVAAKCIQVMPSSSSGALEVVGQVASTRFTCTTLFDSTASRSCCQGVVFASIINLLLVEGLVDLPPRSEDALPVLFRNSLSMPQKKCSISCLLDVQFNSHSMMAFASCATIQLNKPTKVLRTSVSRRVLLKVVRTSDPENPKKEGFPFWKVEQLGSSAPISVFTRHEFGS
jgi:hypothetical protein